MDLCFLFVRLVYSAVKLAPNDVWVTWSFGLLGLIEHNV